MVARATRWYPLTRATPARPDHRGDRPDEARSGFRWLLAATIVNNIGDGVVVSAGPLLVASLTHDPFLVSLALLSENLPTLLFGVIGGVAADRFDRRRMVIVVNLGPGRSSWRSWSA